MDEKYLVLFGRECIKILIYYLKNIIGLEYIRITNSQTIKMIITWR